MPITWQNINVPSLGDSGRALAAGTQAITEAFTPLREQLKAYQTNEAQNWETGKTNSTEAFLAQLTSRYKTPEALAAAQQSGELEALRTSFGAQIDQARTREALDTRGGVLQQRDLTKRTYDNQVIEDTIRPQLQGALALIQKGDKAGFDAFLEAPENAALKKMKQGELMAKLTDFERASAEEARRVSGEGRAVVAQEELLRNGEASRADMLARQKNATGLLDVARENAGTNAVNAETSATTSRTANLEFQMRKDAADREAAAKAGAAAAGIGDGGFMNTAAGRATFSKAMDTLKVTPDAREDIAYNFEKYFRDGINVGTEKEPKFVQVPVSLAIRALEQSGENLLSTKFPGWSRQGDDMANHLKAMLDSPEIRQQLLQADSYVKKGVPVEDPRVAALNLPPATPAASRPALPPALAAPAASAEPRRASPAVLDLGGATPAIKARFAAAAEQLPKAQEAMAAAQLEVAAARVKGPVFEQAARQKMSQARIALQAVRDRLPPGYEEELRRTLSR